jgi:hypothetical protein
LAITPSIQPLAIVSKRDRAMLIEALRTQGHDLFADTIDDCRDVPGAAPGIGERYPNTSLCDTRLAKLRMPYGFSYTSTRSGLM